MFYQFQHLGLPDFMTLEEGENFCFPAHLHQCFEIIFLRSGQLHVTVDSTTYTLTPQKAIMVFPNQIHSLHSTESEHVLCIFSPKLVQAFSSKLTHSVPRNNLFEVDDYLFNALTRITAASTTAEKKGVLYLICSQFNKQALYDHHPAEKEDLLYKIFSFVEKQFAAECTLYSLAEALGYNHAYLSRFFKKAVGITFNTYVNHFRLSHACYLMDNSQSSILSCALDSGYTSIRNFNRIFKLHLGMTPLEYKKRQLILTP